MDRARRGGLGRGLAARRRNAPRRARAGSAGGPRAQPARPRRPPPGARARGAHGATSAPVHSYDRARSGYRNLLQPQDRRSASPGDSAPIAAARRRLFERGIAAPLVEALRARLARRDARGPLLYVGCGEGSILAALARRLGGERLDVEAHGVDLSSAAIRLAAATSRDPTW